ncbi:MAG TPA: DEAD/DEAH box helicase [Egibacteraceae bacterium]|nr:DEAD/DEAH box helicase [Egibacteraceae bacterium]
MSTFSDLGVSPKIIAALAKRGIDAPFPIQALTIADAMTGRDLCGRAPTGSGKTLAFGVPVASLARKGGPRKPSALILVPTRELAAQVAETIAPLAQARGLNVASFYGGTSIGKDRQRLERGVDIAVACPGRLEDLIDRNVVNLSNVRLVVLDEADRMADMGFLPAVKRLLDQTSPERQTLLFSATLDGDVDVVIRRYQRDPARHELAASAEDDGDVRHLFWTAGSSDRVRVTRDIVGRSSPAIVFTRTKHGADRVAKQLVREGVRAVAIHGDRSQGQRQRALADFTAGKASVLVATDVAARGIHVDKVGVVVHFDPAGTDKDYVHRSGRTGRAGADGIVVTLVSPEKRKDVQSLQRALGMRQPIQAPALDQLADGVPMPAPVPIDRTERAERPRAAAPGRNPRQGQRQGASQRQGQPRAKGQGQGQGQGSGRPGGQRRRRAA